MQEEEEKKKKRLAPTSAVDALVTSPSFKGLKLT